MNSLNSKRRGGFSRSKGSSNISNSREKFSFGGKRIEGHVVNKIARPVKKYEGTCPKCHKKYELLLMSSHAKPTHCSSCSSKK